MFQHFKLYPIPVVNISACFGFIEWFLLFGHPRVLLCCPLSLSLFFVHIIGAIVLLCYLLLYIGPHPLLEYGRREDSEFHNNHKFD